MTDIRVGDIVWIEEELAEAVVVRSGPITLRVVPLHFDADWVVSPHEVELRRHPGYPDWRPGDRVTVEDYDQSWKVLAAPVWDEERRLWAVDTQLQDGNDNRSVIRQRCAALRPYSEFLSPQESAARKLYVAMSGLETSWADVSKHVQDRYRELVALVEGELHDDS